mgnify:CR=1 FL=1
MSAAPVRFPGSTVSRNSAQRAAALQGSAYSAAASASPATYGFLGSASSSLSATPVRLGRVRGLLSDDQISGYMVGWAGVSNVVLPSTARLTISVVLYLMDVANGKVTLRKIANTQASVAAGYDTTSNPSRLDKVMLPAAVSVDASLVIVAAASFSFVGGEWTTAPAIYGVAAPGNPAIWIGLARTVGGLPASFVVDTATENVTFIPGIAILTQRNVIDSNVTMC